MRYLSMVKGPELKGPPPQALMDAMNQLMAESIADGSIVQTGGLAGASAAVRVRNVAGKVVVTDGPFTEVKEMVGGYAILEAGSREEAIASARKFMQIHADHWPEWQGECELREINFLAP